MTAKLEWKNFECTGALKAQMVNIEFTVKEKDAPSGSHWQAIATQGGGVEHLGNGTLSECLQICEDAAIETPKEDIVFSGHGPITIEEANLLVDNARGPAAISNSNNYLYNYITTGGLVTQSTEDRLIRLAAIVRGILLREDEHCECEKYPR